MKVFLRPRAFSLVEVTMAMGIASFTLLALVGLLPVGLQTVQNANDEAGAANVVNALTASLRSAKTTDQVNYTWAFKGKDHTYQVGGMVQTVTIDGLTMEGTEGSGLDERFEVVVKFTPPKSNAETGSGVVSVAWPSVANPQWNANDLKWSKEAQGSLTTGLQFLPRS